MSCFGIVNPKLNMYKVYILFVMLVLRNAMGITFVTVVVKLIRMAPPTRLEEIQPPPTMDGIVLVRLMD
jgi:hypothetical protein